MTAKNTIEQGKAITNNSIENTPEYSSTPLHPNGYTDNPFIPFKIKIPDDAVCGTSRIRIVFTDAWAAHPGPVGLTAKGFTIDLGVEITGTNPQRQPTAKLYDEGEAGEPEGLTDGILATKGEASNAFVAGGKLQFTSVEKAWIYTTDGKLVHFLSNPRALATSNFAPGLYVIRMQNQGVIRTRKVAIK